MKKIEKPTPKSTQPKTEKKEKTEKTEKKEKIEKESTQPKEEKMIEGGEEKLSELTETHFFPRSDSISSLSTAL